MADWEVEFQEEEVPFEVSFDDGSDKLPDAAGRSEFGSAEFSVWGTDLDALSDAIAEKAGVEKPVWPDGFRSAVEGIEGVYIAPSGILYRKHMVLNRSITRFSPSITSSMFQNATELETFTSNYSGLIGNGYQFLGCRKLREVNLPQCTGLWLGNTNTFSGCPALEKVTIGSIGTPVHRMDAGKFDTPAITLELYVNADTIADIPTLITQYVPSSWNANATVIYRNSTTGEVITE